MKGTRKRSPWTKHYPLWKQDPHATTKIHKIVTQIPDPAIRSELTPNNCLLLGIIGTIWNDIQKNFKGNIYYSIDQILSVLYRQFPELKQKRNRYFISKIENLIQTEDTMFLKAVTDDGSELFNMITSRRVYNITNKLSFGRIPILLRRNIDDDARLSIIDKANTIEICENGFKATTVLGGSGMVRANIGVAYGDWYYEVKVTKLEHGIFCGGIRIGWSTRFAKTSKPLGYDEAGFSCRNIGGFVSQSLVSEYPCIFREGDIIGCRINLPRVSNEELQIIQESEDRFMKQQFVYFFPTVASKPTACIRKQASMEWFKNGKSMHIPKFFSVGKKEYMASFNRNYVQNIVPPKMSAGRFYPSISMYGNSEVQVRFAPPFIHAPPFQCKGISEYLCHMRLKKNAMDM